MEGKNGGKRLAEEPKQGLDRKKKIALTAAAAAVLALAVGYVGLCAAVGGGRMAPHTAVLGVDVSGLTVAQAEQAVRTALPQRWAGRTVELREGGSGVRVSLEMEGLMEPADLTADLTEALGKDSFLGRGGRYLARLVGRQTEVTPQLRYTPEGQSRVEGALKELTGQLGIQRSETTYELTDTHLIFRKGVTGTAVDQSAVREGVTAAFMGDGSEEVAVSLIQAPPAEPDVAAIQKELYTQAADAYLDRDSEEIVPSVTGRDLDVEAARIALGQTAEGRTCQVPLQITEPGLTTEALSQRLFRDVLGQASTKVSGTDVRKENVGVAAGHVNGTILFPGEEFSFNQTCSPYAVSNGYGKATAYVNGLSKDTVAGGVCQVSSTLYWATLIANLEILDRRPHRYEPSYIKGGLDATVFGNYGDQGSVDFRFKNTTEYPLRITTELDSKSYLKVTISGTDTTGIHGEPYSTNRVVTQAYQTIYEASSSVPQGTTRRDPERTGYSGVTIDTYQKLIDGTGNVLSEKKLYSTKYYCRNETILFNPADMALWGIDPVTGLRSTPAVTQPSQGETPAPAAPETGETASPGGEESPAPAESHDPGPSEQTPPPVQLPGPEPEGDPELPLLPPGSIITGG